MIHESMAAKSTYLGVAKKGMQLESIKSSASQKFVLENRSDVKVKSAHVIG